MSEINLRKISQSAALPSYGDLMDTISVVIDNPSSEEIKVAKDILSRASIVLPAHCRSTRRE